MTDDDDVEERRALQRKAFGPGGGLTDAEAARLRQLDAARRSPSPVPPPSLGSFAAAEDDDEPSAGDDAPVEPDEESADIVTAQSDVPAQRRRRRSLGMLALGAVVVLLLGVGVGWLAFGRSGGTAVSLSAEQQGWQSDLVASGRFDPGSVRALATEDDAVIWVATQNGGASICLVLGAGRARRRAATSGKRCRRTPLGRGDDPARRRVHAPGHGPSAPHARR
ncbi:hypothetical protein AB1285_23900 [Microbacterium sp. NRRL B-14842]|uniref:hypothetical protein n=1 Tax=Microbacterium sp. NRRL B-14842 TaxID=3162881 RepID=UPI003D2CEFAA